MLCGRTEAPGGRLVALSVQPPDEGVRQLCHELCELDAVPADVGRVIVALQRLHQLAQTCLRPLPAHHSWYITVQWGSVLPGLPAQGVDYPAGGRAAVQLGPLQPHVGLVVVDREGEHPLDPGEDPGPDLGPVHLARVVFSQSAEISSVLGGTGQLPGQQAEQRRLPHGGVPAGGPEAEQLAVPQLVGELGGQPAAVGGQEQLQVGERLPHGDVQWAEQRPPLHQHLLRGGEREVGPGQPDQPPHVGVGPARHAQQPHTLQVGVEQPLVLQVERPPEQAELLPCQQASLAQQRGEGRHKLVRA